MKRWWVPRPLGRAGASGHRHALVLLLVLMAGSATGLDSGAAPRDGEVIIEVKSACDWTMNVEGVSIHVVDSEGFGPPLPIEVGEWNGVRVSVPSRARNVAVCATDHWCSLIDGETLEVMRRITRLLVQVSPRESP